VIFDASILTEEEWIHEFTYGKATITHELLHAIGFDHPHEGIVAPEEYDNDFYTQLSYNPAFASDYWWEYYPDGPMLADVAALQHLYGANNETRLGDDIYSFDSSSVFIGTIWDAGGVDTFENTGTVSAIINLNEGRPSAVGSPLDPEQLYNLWIAFGVTIENAIGGDGNDLLIGNPFANQLQGNGGDDILIGGPGPDVFVFNQSFDSDTINDFQIGEDKLLFDGIGEGVLSSYASGTKINFATEGTIYLEGVEITSILADDMVVV